MKKFALIILVAVCGVNMALSQRITDYVQRLRLPDGAESASAQVQVDSKSNAAINSSSPTLDKVPGFRVCIFFDNSQAARQAATTTKTQLSTLHQGLTSYLVYTNPVWKIMVGDCLTRAEATHLMGILRVNFPKAFIVNESIPIKNIIKSTTESLSNTSNEQVVETAR